MRSIGLERAAACSAVKANPLRGRPERVRVGLDCLRSLPQWAGRDRRVMVQAAPALSQAPLRRGPAFGPAALAMPPSFAELSSVLGCRRCTSLSAIETGTRRF